jgi:predicted lipid-binding transport protein (Tim44 family)
LLKTSIPFLDADVATEKRQLESEPNNEFNQFIGDVKAQEALLAAQRDINNLAMLNTSLLTNATKLCESIQQQEEADASLKEEAARYITALKKTCEEFEAFQTTVSQLRIGSNPAAMIQRLQGEIRSHWTAYHAHSDKVNELERKLQACVSRRKQTSASLYLVQPAVAQQIPAPSSVPQTTLSVQPADRDELPVIVRAAPISNPNPQKPGFFKRHLGKLIGGVSGAVIGAGIGALAGFFLAPVTFGLSVPLFAAIGAVVGGAVIGGGLGAGVGAIVDHCTGDRKNPKADIENGLLKPDDSDHPANRKEARKDSTNNASLHAALSVGKPRQVIEPVKEQKQSQSSDPQVNSAPDYTAEEVAKAQKDLSDLLQGLDGLDSLVTADIPSSSTANRNPR